MPTDDRPVLIALGSNIEPRLNLPRAAQWLASRLEILACSNVYESPPVGAPGTPVFLNAVISIAPPFGPRTLKFELLRVCELELGRRRSADRNAPRTIDLDLILFGERVEEAHDMVLPDPDLLRFAHVAVPAADVAPEAVHPTAGQALTAIATGLNSELMQRPDVELLGRGWN